MKTVLTMMAMSMCLGMSARPNWGELTDGYYKYQVDGTTDGSRFDFTCFEEVDGKPSGVWLSSTAEGFTVDEQTSDRWSLPLGITAGDLVRHNDCGWFFFDKKGRAYASMKYIESYQDPVLMRRADSLRLIRGSYDFSSGRSMSFHGDAKEGLLLTVSDGQAPEPFSFQPDVVHQGRALMHIKTAKRRWLLELTSTGINVYQAVWSQKTKKYTRGNLLRRAKGSPFLNIGYEGLPFVDIMARYYTRDMYSRQLERLERRMDGPQAEACCQILRLMVAGASK